MGRPGQVIIAIAVALSGCSTSPAAHADAPESGLYDLGRGPAGAPLAYDLEGPRDVQVLDYDFGLTVLDDPVEGRSYPARLLGRAWLPDGGPAPVVLLLHGQHDWCEGRQLTAVWELVGSAHCRGLEPAWSSIDSHLGYEQVARVLASHGIAAVSIDANDVNAQNQWSVPVAGVPGYGDVGMQARAQLLLATLDALRTADAGDDARHPAFTERFDLGRIGLFGHSRGAEGVTRAPSYAAQAGHWAAPAIAAVWSLAGTARWAVEGYAIPSMPDAVAYASVIPYCDGDVWMLGNAEFHDAYVAAGHPDATQLVFMGANHDYYNTLWPEDDALFTWAEDPYCGQSNGTLGYGRLSPQDQRSHQDVYVGAFFRLHLLGQEALRPMFSGTAAPPASACPAAMAECAGLVHVSSTWRQTMLGAPRVEGQAWTCAPPEPPCEARVVGAAQRIVVDLQSRAVLAVDLPDTADATHVTFRIAVDAPDGSAPPLVELRSGGTWVALHEHSAAVFPPPGQDAQRVVLHQARVPVAALGGLDDVLQVRLTAASDGPAQVHLAEFGLLRLA